MGNLRGSFLEINFHPLLPAPLESFFIRFYKYRQKIREQAARGGRGVANDNNNNDDDDVGFKLIHISLIEYVTLRSIFSLLVVSFVCFSWYAERSKCLSYH